MRWEERDSQFTRVKAYSPPMVLMTAPYPPVDSPPTLLTILVTPPLSTLMPISSMGPVTLSRRLVSVAVKKVTI